VEIDLPALPGLVLRIEDAVKRRGSYPTSRLQKGLLLIHNGEELAEEAVGFGVPVLKRGLHTVFPGGLDLTAQRSGSEWEIAAVFQMCLVEKLHRPGLGSLNSKPLYAIKNLLAALIRRFPVLRGALTGASGAVRRTFGWETTYEKASFRTKVKVIYTVNGEAGVIAVEVDTAALLRDGISEVAVMNEQGGHHFDRYCDSGGTCQQGGEIGCWDRVTAGEASFISDAHGLAFTLRQASGAALYRGRELVGERLAWAGFGYTFRPTGGTFSYEVRIGGAP
jgi:hypothetical protein